LEKSPVTAIMLNHEQAQDQSRGRYGEKQGQPVTDIQRQPHQYPQNNKGQKRRPQLKQGAKLIGLTVTRQSLRQSGQIDHFDQKVNSVGPLAAWAGNSHSRMRKWGKL